MKLENNLAFEILEKIPVGIYVINKDNQVIYYNTTFSQIFETGVHKVNSYFGSIVRCRYCLPNGSPDDNEFRCNHCQIRKQHQKAFDLKNKVPEEEIVQEFTVGQQKKIKYLSIQPVYLDQDVVMVTVRDLTDAAEKLL